MSADKDNSTSNLAEVEPESASAAKEEHAQAEAAAGGRGEEDKRPKAAETASPELSAAELKQQLEEAQRTAESHWDAVLRGRAELENLRKRTERDLENAHKYGLERLVSELLPVKDSLELGLAAGNGEAEQVAKLREGMELTLKMFTTALEKFGVIELNPEGEDFNPDYHQAMTVQETDGQAPNTVVSVIQKGYLLNDRLIRPALVIVAK